MLRNGFTIIKNVFDNNEVKLISDEIDRIELEIEGKYDLNLDEDIIRCPLDYSKIILEVATHKKLLSLIKKILCENFVLLVQNTIINKPNKINFQSKWHRDFNYQHFTSSIS